MKIVIIFPKRFFTKDQLSELSKHDLEFIEQKDINLDEINALYSSEELILAVDPTYLVDSWEGLPVSRIRKMKGLKALCLTTTSFSWVDINKLREMGVIVTNTPRKSTNAVAEFNIYMMLSLLRKMPLIAKNNWVMNYDRFVNHEAKGLVAGIVGLGQIGNRVAELCVGLDMKVCYWNRSPKDVVYEKLELDDLIKRSDVLFNTIATPPEVKNLISDDMIKSMKETAIIVSTSDFVYNKDLVFQMVAEDKLGGFATESKDLKFTEFKGNVMIFPEQAYFTTGTLQNTARIVTETILSVIKGSPINKVN